MQQKNRRPQEKCTEIFSNIREHWLKYSFCYAIILYKFICKHKQFYMLIGKHKSVQALFRSCVSKE
jgi:hypothetical protein